jgi:hypothetical protein
MRSALLLAKRVTPLLPCLQVGKAYYGPREALRLTGNFVLGQLLDPAQPDSALLASSPFVAALLEEVRGCALPAWGPGTSDIPVCALRDFLKMSSVQMIS